MPGLWAENHAKKMTLIIIVMIIIKLIEKWSANSVLNRKYDFKIKQWQVGFKIDFRPNWKLESLTANEI